MSSADRDHRLDHIVVLMFENRSFDNLLGYLYRPGEVPSFDGVAFGSHSNPIPPDLATPGQSSVPVHAATNLDTPDPDPGEEHPHTNTQLFGSVAPPENRFRAVHEMEPPFNAPSAPTVEPTMDGFVADYINSFRAEMYRLPNFSEYSQIMACYTPDQLPVLSTVARGFATFDRWFCEVPSQTYCNRSFFHAASSSGFVLNGPHGKFASLNDAPTIFERLHAAQVPWRVYIDPAQLVPATALIHARSLAPFFADHFATIFDFYDDARKGTLPSYAFIEPNMLHPHTDMHPPGFGRLRHELHLPAPGAMLGGERLLADVYNAVRSSSSSSGSNFENTLLLITFDEHGGTYDHVPPPRVPPPGPPTGREEEGFDFTRSGVRVPTIAISAWLEPKTVVSQEFRSTSLIRTLRERWSLGPPLTQRDAIAADLAPVLARPSPRPPEEWPTVAARPMGLIVKVEEALAWPLTRLERDLAGEALAHEASSQNARLDMNIGELGRKEALRHLRRIRDNMFPSVSHGRGS
jgi:phospholipase C